MPGKDGGATDDTDSETDSGRRSLAGAASAGAASVKDEEETTDDEEGIYSRIITVPSLPPSRRRKGSAKQTHPKRNKPASSNSFVDENVKHPRRSSRSTAT